MLVIAMAAGHRHLNQHQNLQKQQPRDLHCDHDHDHDHDRHHHHHHHPSHKEFKPLYQKKPLSELANMFDNLTGQHIVVDLVLQGAQYPGICHAITLSTKTQLDYSILSQLLQISISHFKMHIHIQLTSLESLPNFITSVCWSRLGWIGLDSFGLFLTFLSFLKCSHSSADSSEPASKGLGLSLIQWRNYPSINSIN